MSRRYRTSQANVRSTTHRRGCTRKPSAALAVIVTAHRQTRRTNSWNRLLKPLSAMTSRTRGRYPRAAAKSPPPPSPSRTSAARPDTAHPRPRESAPMNRLRPPTFFPPVVPLGAAAVGGLDRLAVHPEGGGRGRGPGLQADVLAQGGVDAVPDAGQPPQAAGGADGLPPRAGRRAHPPVPT